MSSTQHSPIAMEIGTRLVRAVQLRMGRPRERLAAWARVPRASDAWTSDEAARTWSALRRQGFVGRDVVLVMPATDAAACLLEFRGRSTSDVDEVTIRSELSRMHRLAPDSFECCAWKAPAQGRGESWLAVCTTHDHAESLAAPLDELGLQIVGIDAGCFALARGVWGDLASSSLGVGVHLARECARFVAVVNDHVAYERVLAALGWHRVFEQARTQLGMDEAVTAELLRAMGRAESRRANVQTGIVRLRPLVEEHMRQLALELRQSLTYLEGGYSRLPLAGIRMTGDGSTIGGWTNAIQSATGTAARVVGARDLVDAADTLDDEAGADLTLAIGLARYPKPEEARA